MDAGGDRLRLAVRPSDRPCVAPAVLRSAVPLTASMCLRRMTPGLAFFEAGLLRSRNSISILMQCWAGLIILSTLW